MKNLIRGLVVILRIIAVVAHIEVLVTFLLVNFFSFLVITRSHGLRIGPNLVLILPTGLPELFQQPRTLYNSQKVEILKFHMFEKPKKKLTIVVVFL